MGGRSASQGDLGSTGAPRRSIGFYMPAAKVAVRFPGRASESEQPSQKVFRSPCGTDPPLPLENPSGKVCFCGRLPGPSRNYPTLLNYNIIILKAGCEKIPLEKLREKKIPPSQEQIPEQKETRISDFIDLVTFPWALVPTCCLRAQP